MKTLLLAAIVLFMAWGLIHILDEYLAHAGATFNQYDKDAR